MKQKAIALLSGGIDSPVAIYLMSKKYNITLLHFENYPLAPKIIKKKVKDLTKKLREITKQKMPLYVIHHGEHLKLFVSKKTKLNCILCRRLMLRIANKLAKKLNIKYIITGESLAQVASQTLSNLRTEDLVSDLSVLRPLIGFDKEEIIEIAKEIGTFEISTQRGCDLVKNRVMCCFATPKYPATRSRVSEIEELENSLNIEKLAEKALKKLKIINL